MIKYLVFLAALLAATTSLFSQPEARTPETREAYLNSLYGDTEPDEDLVNAIYDAYVAEKDTLGIMHTNGWLAYVEQDIDVEEAMRIALTNLKLIAQQGIAKTDYRLAPTYSVLGIITVDNDAALAYMKQTLAAAPPDSYFAFTQMTDLAIHLTYDCDPQVEELFTSMLAWNARQPQQIQKRLTAINYGESRALYLFICAGNVERAEIIYRSQYDLLRKEDDNVQTNTDLLVAAANLAYMNADMGRLDVAERLLTEVESVNLDQTPLLPFVYNDLIVCMYQVAMLSSDLPRARKNLETQLAFLLSRPELALSDIMDNAYQCLYLTCSKMNDLSAAKEYLLEAKLYRERSPLGYSHSMSELLYITNDYQACIDTARWCLQQQCSDCRPGELPTVDNTLLPEFQLERLTGFV